MAEGMAAWRGVSATTAGRGASRAPDVEAASGAGAVNGIVAGPPALNTPACPRGGERNWQKKCRFEVVGTFCPDHDCIAA